MAYLHLQKEIEGNYDLTTLIETQQGNKVTWDELVSLWDLVQNCNGELSYQTELQPVNCRCSRLGCVY